MQRIRRTATLILQRGTLLLASGLLLGVGMSVSDRLMAAGDVPVEAPAAVDHELTRLGTLVEELQGKLTVTDLKLDRLTRIAQYSTAYRIPANLAGQIYDAALAEGLHPSLGFQLVKVESGFRTSAQSSKQALGLTQVRLPTAKEVDPSITRRDLLAPETNLRVGFRVLRRLLAKYDHDLEMALRAYNLGPTGAMMSFEDTTSNARVAVYADKVMRGVRGTPVTPRRP